MSGLPSASPPPTDGDPGAPDEARRHELDALIGELAAQVHSLEAHLVDALAELVSLGGATGVGYRSTAHWLSVRSLG